MHKEDQPRESLFAKSNLDKMFTKNANPKNPPRFIYLRKFRNPWSSFRQQSSADHIFLPLCHPTLVQQREHSARFLLYITLLDHPRPPPQMVATDWIADVRHDP